MKTHYQQSGDIGRHFHRGFGLAWTILNVKKWSGIRKHQQNTQKEKRLRVISPNRKEMPHPGHVSWTFSLTPTTNNSGQVSSFDKKAKETSESMIELRVQDIYSWFLDSFQSTLSGVPDEDYREKSKGQIKRNLSQVPEVRFVGRMGQNRDRSEKRNFTPFPSEIILQKCKIHRPYFPRKPDGWKHAPNRGDQAPKKPQKIF